MKHKLCLLILLLLIPSLAFAGNLISFGFGSVNQFQLDPFSPETPFASIVDVHNWATGGEARLRVLGVNFEGYALIQQGEIIDVTEEGKPVFKDDISQRIFGMIGAGFSTEVAEFTTLSLAAGALTGIDITKGFGVNLWMGDRNNVFSHATWRDFLANVPLAYRVRLDLNLGGFSIGIHYQVPSHDFSYNNFTWDAMAPNWRQGKIGASFITKFF